MFRAMIPPIFRSTGLFVTACGTYNAPIAKSACSLEAEELHFQATGRQNRGYIKPQAVTYSLVLLKMGGIIARNMLSWLE
jgi:hypothetical protein